MASSKILNLRTPIVIASGPGGFGEYLNVSSIDWSVVGAYTLKTITLNPKAGNKPPRIYAFDSFMINRIGLENPGFEGLKRVIESGELDEITARIPAILSLGGDSFEEYVEITKLVKPYLQKFIAIEYNFSCPNVHHGGLSIMSDRDEWRRLLKEIRKETDAFIIAKLGIESGFIEQMAKIVAHEGWDGVTVINTIRGLMVNTEGQVILGGLSGPALYPIALRAVYEVRKALPDIFIIASGGIYKPYQVKEMLNFGANAVSIGSALFQNEGIINEIGREFVNNTNK
jgi:dihydroorotate dehydrogenase (NAD+) catalytic subunit